MLNALTIDVEDYFQVNAFTKHIRQDQWSSYPLRVDDNTRRILDMLDSFNIKATFFVLGWVAERCPSLVKDIHSAGHEVACHGYWHQQVTSQSRQKFREDIRTSKTLLEDLIGQAVLGYRAPSYSISTTSLWAFDELLEAGFKYDSSVFPIYHDLYGIPHWPRFPFPVVKDNHDEWSPSTAPGLQTIGTSDRILEIPITTLNIAGKNLPIAGGGYFRLFPYCISRWGLRRINRTENQSFVFYLHPWELDPQQPRINGVGFKSRFRHYLNLDKTEHRFQNLLTDFRFTSLKELYF